MLKSHHKHIVVLALLLGVVIALFPFPTAKDEIKKLEGDTMGTQYHIQVVDMPMGLSDESFASEIAERLFTLDKEQMSTYEPSSELSRFNDSEVGQWFTVSEQMIEVLKLADEVHQLSDGAFDVTVGPLVNLWGFGPEHRPVKTPSQEAINQAFSLLGQKELQIFEQPPALIKSKPLRVDLSAIAKGYAVDQIAEYFDSLDIQHYLIEIGGELKLKGNKPDGQSWVTAIETPNGQFQQVYRAFYSNGESIAVAGSGDYRNYYELDGVRYSHEIDPSTGRPITHNLASVTVIDYSAARADAFATAFMVLGPDKAFELANRENLAAYFILKTEQGFEDRVTDPFNAYLNRKL